MPGLRSYLPADLDWWFNRLRYIVASANQRRSIGSVEAEYTVGTFREYRRLQSFTDEEELISDLLSRLTSEDVFYDIGANVGTHSCFAGQIAAHTVAFEPHPDTASRLRENLQRNDISATVYELALADRNGLTELFRPESTSHELGTGEFSILDSESSADSWSVDVIRGDELLKRDHLPQPDVIKIDVEGAELQVLNGMTRTLANTRLVYCEVHPNIAEVQEVTDLLDSLGFVTETMGKREGGHSFVRAWRE